MTKEEFIYQWIYLDGFKLKPEDPMFDEVLSDLNSVIESEIKAKLPTDEEVEQFIKDHPGNMGNFIIDKAIDAGFRAGIRWLKSKLT